jgi:ArsR family transcriptional regulator
MIEPLAFYKNLANETRLKCLLLIQQEGELHMSELMQALHELQPKIAHHIAPLLKSNLLLGNQKGQWIYYRLNPNLPLWVKTVLAQTAKSNFAFVEESLKNLYAMGDRPRLVKRYRD